MAALRRLLILTLCSLCAVVGQEETSVQDVATDDQAFDDTDFNGNGGEAAEMEVLNDVLVPVQDENSTCIGPQTPGELLSLLLTGYDRLTRPNVAQAKVEFQERAARRRTQQLQGGPQQYMTPAGPLPYAAPPDVARIQLHVLALNNLDQKRNEYQLTGWFRRTWKDSRLSFLTYSEGGCFPDDAQVGFPEEIVHRIWNPDFYIENAADPPKTTGGALWISPDGGVLWSSQLEMTLACKMEFREFPFDTQKCYFKVGSYLYNANTVKLDFFQDRAPVTLAIETDPNRLAHGGSTEWSIAETLSVDQPPEAGSLQEDSSVTLELNLRRNSEYYTAFVMTPSIMFVIIGWASFFISRSAAPARVAMSMICFLTNSNFLSGQLGQLPRLGNAAWLLKFLAASTYFTFYAVMEYCLCNYLYRIEARIADARAKARAHKIADTSEEGDDMGTSKRERAELAVVTKADIIATGFNRKVDLLMLNPKTNRMYFKDEHVDVFSRYAYPTAYFVVFMGLWFIK